MVKTLRGNFKRLRQAVRTGKPLMSLMKPVKVKNQQNQQHLIFSDFRESQQSGQTSRPMDLDLAVSPLNASVQIFKNIQQPSILNKIVQQVEENTSLLTRESLEKEVLFDQSFSSEGQVNYGNIILESDGEGNKENYPIEEVDEGDED